MVTPGSGNEWIPSADDNCGTFQMSEVNKCLVDYIDGLHVRRQENVYITGHRAEDTLVGGCFLRNGIIKC